MQEGTMLFAIVAAATITSVTVPGNPFMALSSPDGKTVYVSIDSDTAADNGIEVFSRSGSALERTAFIPLEGTPLGLAITRDGRTLFAAIDKGVAAIRVDASATEAGSDVLYLELDGVPGTIEVAASPDGSSVFFTNEQSATVGVATYGPPVSDLSANPVWNFVGLAPTGAGPVGVALSPDGAWLYVTSQIEPSSFRPCHGGSQLLGRGTLRVIDARKALHDPASATVGVTPAGCSPVRVALSPDGAEAWVTARGDNQVIEFDTNALRTRTAQSQIASVDTGPAPVGAAVVASGLRLLVTDSNRFGSGSSTVEVIETGKSAGKKPVRLSSLAAGDFPREITESPSHDVVFVTNYRSRTVEIIPENDLP